MDDFTDDAPLTTAKHGDGGEHAAQLGLDPKGGSLIARSVTVNRPKDELFRFWRDFSNLATFMDNIERVDVVDERNSHWVIAAPGGRKVEWNARITDQREGEYIVWTTTEAPDVENSGRIEFRDAGARGTIVTAMIDYDAPGGGFGKAIAKLFQRDPAIQARRDLRRFKQLMETGEVATSARTRKEHEEEKA